MSERILSVRLRAVVTGYTQAMGQAADATKAVSDAGRGLEGTGRRLSAFGAATAAIGGYGVKQAIGFESAMTGVRKTVTATSGQMDELKASIVEMANEVPSSREEIAAIAEAAGQLGIQTENVAGFTRTIIDLGNATDLVGEQGANSLARFANITQMAQTDFERLGSAIVAVGNDGAATESEIAEMALRLAGAGNTVGMTEAQIIGMAGALSSVGIEAEAGGSAMSTAMLKMQSAVIGGTKELGVFARTAGMTADEFSAMFREDPGAAIAAFTTGLDKVTKSGGDASAVLGEVGLSEIRTRDAFMRLGGAGDMLTKSIDLSTKAWGENSALAKEAGARYGTTESRLKTTANRVTDVARKFGEALLPAVNAALNVVELGADAAGVLVGAFAALPGPLKVVAGSIVGLAVASGPTIWALGKLAMLMGGPLIKAALMVGPALKTTFSGWTSGLMSATSAARTAGASIGKALLGAMAPAIAATAAIAAIAGVIYLARKASEEWQSKNRSAAHSADQLAESTGLATKELKAFNEETGKRDGGETSDQKFAVDNSDAIKTLRELKREDESLAQGRLHEIAYRLILEGNTPEQVIENVKRLADVAGIEIPITFTVEGVGDIDNEIDSAVRSAKHDAEQIAASEPSGVWEAIFGDPGEVAVPPEIAGRLKNIAQMAADAYATGDVDGFIRLMGESEMAMNGNATMADTLTDEFLRLSGAQDVSTTNAGNFRDMLGELSRASNVPLPDQDKFKAWLDETDGMSDAAANARILELAAADAAAAVDKVGDSDPEVPDFTDPAVAAETFAASLEDMANNLSLSRVDFDAGAAAAQAWAEAIDMATRPAARLGAGLQGGSAFKGLRETMTGEKAIAEIMAKAADGTDDASKAVDRLSDSARRADPKMSALQIRMSAMAAAGDAFRTSIDDSSMLDDHVSSALSLGDAYKDFEKTYRRLPAVLDITAMATGKLRPRQVEAIQNTLALGKAARDYLATLIEMGDSDGDVRSQAAAMRNEYKAMFIQMGMNEQQANNYIEAMGLMPSQIDTAITVSGIEAARAQLDAYLQLLDGRIPPEVATSVVARIESGDIEGAAKMLADYAKSNPALIEVGVKTDDSTEKQIDDVKSKLGQLPASFDPLKAMLGDYSDEQQAALDAVMQFGDGVQGYLAQVAHDGNADEIRDQAHRIRDAFLEQMSQFGITGDAAQEYLDLVGLSDWQIDSAINLSGDAEALTKLQLLSQFMKDEIPPEVAVEVSALIDEGKYQEAADRLGELTKPRTAAVTFQMGMGSTWFDPNVWGTPGGVTVGNPSSWFNPGNYRQAAGVPARAAGGSFWAGQKFLVGERGPEIAEFGGAGQITDAETTRHYRGTSVPVGANLAPAAGMGGGADAALLDALRSAGSVTFGDIKVTSPVERDTPRRIVEKVGSGLHLAGKR